MIDFEGSRQTAAQLAGIDQGTAQGGPGHRGKVTLAKPGQRPGYHTEKNLHDNQSQGTGV